MRPSSICPHCGSGHTVGLQATDRPAIFYRCPDCRASWSVIGAVTPHPYTQDDPNR